MSDYVETNIGEFPKEWEIKRLDEIAEQMYYGLSVSGVNTPTQYKLITTTSINKETFKLDEEKIPFCNLITNKDRKSKELTKYLVKKGDILISRSGTTGITILIDKDYKNMLFGSYLIKIRLNSIIDPKFFWYFAQSPFYWKQISSRGATIKNINLEILRNLRVPIPPLEEQKKIVELLQKATDIYYTLKDYIIQIRNSTETITKVIRKKLLTKGIGHSDYVETDIGEFPKDWEVRRLNEIAIIRSGFSERKRDENSKVIHLRPDNIDNETDRIVFHRIVYIPESPKIERYLLRHLDIVLVNTNGSIDHIGKLGIIDMPLNQKITFSNHLTAIRIVSKDVEPYYIYYLLSWYHLNGSFKKVVKNQAGKWNLNLDTIRNLLIPLPPLEEQKKIVEILQKVDELIIRFNDFLQNLEDEANTLYNSILRLALTGKLTEDWRRQIILLRSVVIPYLVHKVSKIKGRPVYMTELMKYLFLLQKEYNINLAYNFEPYKYGPFTPQLYKDLEELKDRIEVKEVKDDVDKNLITSKELPQVNQDIANAVNDLINRFGNKDLKELLSYVYKKYPEYTVKSKLNLYNFLK